MTSCSWWDGFSLFSMQAAQVPALPIFWAQNRIIFLRVDLRLFFLTSLAPEASMFVEPGEHDQIVLTGLYSLYKLK